MKQVSKISLVIMALMALMALTIALLRAQTIENSKVATTDPISTVGHGAILDSKGNEIDPSPEFVIDAQHFYLKRLFELADDNLRAEFKTKQQRLEFIKGLTQQEQILLNSALIAWLIDTVKPADAAHLASKNGALRNKFFHITGKQSTVSQDLLDGLKKEGLIKYLSATMAGGQAYIEECRRAGVPIPPDWGDPAWGRRVGTLRTRFIIRNEIAEVFAFRSPNGVCLALPRSRGESEPITALGIICLGNDTATNTSKACFWDNINVTPDPVPSSDDIYRQFRFPFDIARGDTVPLSRFGGGADLFGGNGVCSDCHAGHNPFIVHPGDAMDLGTTITPSGWYEPLVDPRWPQNPGPTTLLESIRLNPTDRSCLMCHSNLRKIRFPEVSTQLPGYCQTVLRDALGIGFDPTPPVPPATMPLGDIGNPNYQRHIDALITTCNLPPMGTPIRVVINGATQSLPTSDRVDTGGDLGPCTSSDCPIGFCYWRTLHGPFWQRTDSSIPIGAPDYRGSFVRIYAEGGRWKWRALSDPTGGAGMPPPGGTAECMVFRNISGIPDPSNCFSAFATIVDPIGTRLTDSVDATVGGTTVNVLSGFIGNVAQAAFGMDQRPDTLRISEEAGRVLLSQRHTDNPPPPLRIGPLTGESWTNGCNAWTPNYAVRDILSESDVQLVPASQSRDVFCFITGIAGAWSSTRSAGTLQPFAEIYSGREGDIRLRVFPSDGPDRVGAYASCVKLR